MKRDLLFIAEHLAAVLDERRLAIIFRLHGIGKANGSGDAPAKLLASFLRKADESTLGRVLVAITVLQSANNSNESAKALREAAEFYKVDVAAQPLETLAESRNFSSFHPPLVPFFPRFFVPTPSSLLPPPYSLLPTPYSLLPTPYSLVFRPLHHSCDMLSSSTPCGKRNYPNRM